MKTTLKPIVWEKRYAEGFRISYKYGVSQRQGAKANMKLDIDNLTVVAEYVEEERMGGRIVSPLRRGEWPVVQVN